MRRLERAIARVARKVTLQIRREASRKGDRDAGLVERSARAGDVLCRRRCARRLPAGVATGLAWTEAGGDVLYIESTLLPEGKGLTLTGQLGEVMQESAKIAQSYHLGARGRAWHRSAR